LRRVAATTADPEAAREWREYARYVAGVAGIGGEHPTDAQLAAAAKRAQDHPVIAEAGQMVLDALDAATQSLPLHPYRPREVCSK